MTDHFASIGAASDPQKYIDSDNFAALRNCKLKGPTIKWRSRFTHSGLNVLFVNRLLSFRSNYGCNVDCIALSCAKDMVEQ